MKFIYLITLILLSSCSSKPFVVKETQLSVTSGQEIYIVSHGWHTGFVIPAQTIQKELPQLKQRFGDTPFLEFGWGDKGFYQANEITSKLTMHAIFWPTASVMHVVEVPTIPQQYFRNSEVKRLWLNKEKYALFITYLTKSFLKKDNKIIELKNGIYGNSQFYKGEGNYYLMNTCNKWTAKGLKSAQLDIYPLFKLTAGSVIDSLPNTQDSPKAK
ncbi:TIGR02117 family protein [Lentisphaera marina]|uniref:TIGR02117 family protein n=1 Tax=Lentisphaera marina TaxID=1111041 RepID=UPI002367269D|nr:TIGR02117 family protein [Lentisphaera marina]MDD7984259.1 TIGR02117 family protein [Lentisphaera marina]